MVQFDSTISQRHGASPTDRRVTTFTATERGRGFQVMIAGCMPLHSSSNMPRYVRGTITFDGCNVPVVDLDAKAGRAPKTVTDDACVVLFTQKRSGRPVAGALYRDIGEVLELVRRQDDLLDRDRFWTDLTL
ncbi:MAG TPA: hypothetical protein ENN87_11525 [Phycisphaerales bacterium]|nr:hypothetical protein [Phycisphaerales bacterium]